VRFFYVADLMGEENLRRFNFLSAIEKNRRQCARRIGCKDLFKKTNRLADYCFFKIGIRAVHGVLLIEMRIFDAGEQMVAQ